ncbi:MAG TPA: histidine phosphatase family protein [Chroococcidiopsis sp.]
MRHGISTYNVLRRVQGHCDESNLTEEGRVAASKVGVTLQGLPFAAAYSSPLQRAKETAELIMANLGDSAPASGLQFTDLLKEINLAEWEGLEFDAIAEQDPERYRIWRDRPHTLTMVQDTPSGPVEFFPVVDLYEQAKTFWQKVIPNHDGDTILVVAHSAINRALISTAIGLDVTGYKSFYQANCGINVINFSGGWDQPAQLESVNQVTHLGNPFPAFRGKHGGIRMLLVRHGETDWNRQKKFQGQIDVPLNPEGRSQSGRAAAFLKDVPIDRAVTSPMLRPKETAEIILSGRNLTLELDDNLKEISHGLWEGKLESEIEEIYATELDQWKRSPHLVQMPEGENLDQVWERAIAAWQAIVASTPVTPGQVTTVMVVAHDAINKAILCHLIGFGPDAFWTFKQGNGSVSVIDYAGGATAQPLLQSINITSHLSAGVLDQTAAGAL